MNPDTNVISSLISILGIFVLYFWARPRLVLDLFVLDLEELRDKVEREHGSEEAIRSINSLIRVHDRVPSLLVASLFSDLSFPGQGGRQKVTGYEREIGAIILRMMVLRFPVICTVAFGPTLLYGISRDTAYPEKTLSRIGSMAEEQSLSAAA